MATADFDLLAALSEISKKAAGALRPSERRPAQRELEDLLALMNFTLSRIDRSSDCWAAAIADQAAAFDWGDSRDLSELYRGWLEAARLIASYAREFHAACPIQFAEDFQNNLRRVSLMSLDTQRMRRSIESLESGAGIPFDRAMGELRDKLR